MSDAGTAGEPRPSRELFILAMPAKAGYADMPVLVIATDATLPVSINDDAPRLRRKPFNLTHFVHYVTEAAGPGRFRN